MAKPRLIDSNAVYIALHCLLIQFLSYELTRITADDSATGMGAPKVELGLRFAAGEFKGSRAAFAKGFIWILWRPPTFSSIRGNQDSTSTPRRGRSWNGLRTIFSKLNLIIVGKLNSTLESIRQEVEAARVDSKTTGSIDIQNYKRIKTDLDHMSAQL